jgi:molecular chaperone GrpE
MEPNSETNIPTPSPETADEAIGSASLEAALAAKAQEVERLQDRLVRLQAEFENYKKRVTRERAEFLKYAAEGLLLEFLPVLDNLERGIASARVESTNREAVVDGIEMIARLFRAALEKAGVKPMESVGKPFDPNLQQAVAQVESAEWGDNVVVEEIQKGYLLEGRVLRAAMVKVSRAPAPREERDVQDEGADE